MTYRDIQAPIRSIPQTLLAALALLLFSALSVLSLNMAGQSWSLDFLPLIVLLIWPRRAGELLSLLLIFTVGIFMDWATGGVVGQWALIFTLIWVLFRPELRSDPYGLLRLVVDWVMICAVAMTLIGLSGWFVYRVTPDIPAMLRHVVPVSLLLPAVLGLRHWLARRFTDEDDWR